MIENLTLSLNSGTVSLTFKKIIKNYFTSKLNRYIFLLLKLNEIKRNSTGTLKGVMAKNVFTTTTTKNVFVGRNVAGQKGLLVIAYFCSSHRHLSFLFRNFFCRLDHRAIDIESTLTSMDRVDQSPI
jgi:hypothetical protein